MDYPIWELAMGGGMLMAIVAIPHVIVSHFAIGGGLLIVVTETLAVKRNDPELRELARRSSLVLILVSTVFGAISGVGIWVVAGLISPAAISALIHTYVWGWAIEWVFFVIEIVAALVYYTTWDKVSKGAHLLVGWLYFIGAYLSLVIINGIITFMLTPGRWLETDAGLQEDEPQQLASQIAGRDLSGFFDQVLYSTEELPVEDALRSLGVALDWRSRTSMTDTGSVTRQADSFGAEGSSSGAVAGRKNGQAAEGGTNAPVKPWLGANFDDAPGGVRLLQVLAGGPAERAGLAAGDILIAMNGLSVNNLDVENHLVRHANLESIGIHFFRLGQLHDAQLPLEPAPEDTAALQIVDTNRLSQWLADGRLRT